MLKIIRLIFASPDDDGALFPDVFGIDPRAEFRIMVEKGPGMIRGIVAHETAVFPVADDIGTGDRKMLPPGLRKDRCDFFAGIDLVVAASSFIRPAVEILICGTRQGKNIEDDHQSRKDFQTPERRHRPIPQDQEQRNKHKKGRQPRSVDSSSREQGKQGR